MHRKLYTSIGLLILIVVAINFVSTEFHLRFDFTEDGEYTLSKATSDILNDLEDPVTVKAYFSQNLPPDVAKTKQDFQEMLIEYANRADGKVVYEFINPSETEATEQEANKNGIRTVMINVREKDQVKQQKAFMGALVLLGANQEVIPFIQPGAAMEYALSTAIKKLSVKEKPIISFLQGHGEPKLTELAQAKTSLDILYSSQEVTLSDSTDISPTSRTLVIIRPTDTIPASHFQKIENFVNRGGRVLVAINRVDGNFQNAMGTSIATGLEQWLFAKGIEVEDNFVIDTKCGSVTMQQQTSFGTLQQQIQFPYIPLVSRFSNHPSVKGLEAVMLQFASTIRYTGDTTKKFVPIAFSSQQSNALKAPLYFEVQKQWTQNEFPQNGLTLAAAIEGKLSGNTKSKMIVIGDGDFAINGESDRARQVNADNVSLLVNSIDWLSDDTGLIELRTKGASMRPIAQLEDSTKLLLKYGNFLLPIVLAIGYGIYRSQRNKMKRYKWMSENWSQAG
jgi:gliding-associated putative ABC transporter substrate-binding component GldG